MFKLSIHNNFFYIRTKGSFLKLLSIILKTTFWIKHNKKIQLANVFADMKYDTPLGKWGVYIESVKVSWLHSMTRVILHSLWCTYYTGRFWGNCKAKNSNKSTDPSFLNFPRVLYRFLSCSLTSISFYVKCMVPIVKINLYGLASKVTTFCWT